MEPQTPSKHQINFLLQIQTPNQALLGASNVTKLGTDPMNAPLQGL